MQWRKDVPKGYPNITPIDYDDNNPLLLQIGASVDEKKPDVENPIIPKKPDPAYENK